MSVTLTSGDTFTPVVATKSQLENNVIDIVAGQFIATIDTHELYIDLDSSTRKKYSDIEFGTYSSITSKEYPLLDKLYFATDTHQLLQAYYEPGASQATWKVLNAGTETRVVTNSNAAVTAELDNNTIYNFTNANITSISLTAANTLDYCTICFTAGTSTTFSPPVGSRCLFFDCSGGIFTPVAGKEYQIAVDKLGNQLTFYVLRLDLNAAS